MTVRELIEALQKYDGDTDVCIGYDFDLKISTMLYEKGHTFPENVHKYYHVPKELKKDTVTLW